MKTLVNSFVKFASKFTLGLAAILFSTSTAFALNTEIHPEVEKIIMQIQQPEGVLIDIETLSTDGIKEYLSTVETQVSTLRQRYADLDIVIISHGLELVAFLKPEAGKEMSDEAMAFKTMMETQNVVLHICETSASWQGYLPEDFLDFVDTVPSGLATINDYKALDYVLVPIEQLTDKQREVIMNMREQD